MIAYHFDPPVKIRGCAVRVLSRFELNSFRHRGNLFFTAQKDPVAILVESTEKRELQTIDGLPLDEAALETLLERSSTPSLPSGPPSPGFTSPASPR